MPRTFAGDSPDCPPFRAIAFDNLGLIKVVEVNEQKKVPEVVCKWGEPDSQRCVMATSLSSDSHNPLLAVARKNKSVDVMDPSSGDVISTSHVGATDSLKPVDEQHTDDPIAGLHLFRKERSNKFFVCTEKGDASIYSFNDVASMDQDLPTPTTWRISGSGNVLCCQVHYNEKFAIFGGKGTEVNLWDIESHCKLWTAKYPPRDHIGLYSPTFVTAATFLKKDDDRKIVIGTGNHQVRLYDASMQRRAVLSFDFGDTPIKVIKEDSDGHTVYVGNGTGDLSYFDMRTGKLLGSFKGKCSGSIRSISKHPERTLIASCGLDRYLRIWDTQKQQILASVFLKQQLVSVILDPNLTPASTIAGAIDKILENKETELNDTDLIDEHKETELNDTDFRDENQKSANKEKKSSKKKLKKHDRDERKKSSKRHTTTSDDLESLEDEIPIGTDKKQSTTTSDDLESLEDEIPIGTDKKQSLKPRKKTKLKDREQKNAD